MPAIRTIDELRERCRVDDVTGCWLLGASEGGGSSLRLADLGRTVSIGVAICVLTTGRMPERGVVWHCTCETRRCANPAHRTAGTRSTQMLAAQLQRDAATRARIAAGKRAASALSDEAVADIREST